MMKALTIIRLKNMKKGVVSNMKQKIWGWALMLVVIVLIVGCSSETKGNDSEETNDDTTDADQDKVSNETDDPEEVNVSLMIHWGEKEFENFFRKHIEEALPHIKLTYIQSRDQNDIEENFAKGLVPDLVMGSNFHMYEELDLARDQTPLIEKYGIDFDRFDPNVVETLRNASPEGEILALPLFQDDGMMGYNKDIFDAFGVPYPEDNMTWDEAIELGKQLVGERDGKVYRGIWPDKDQLSQVSATLIDGDTNEPNILNNKELHLFLERLQTIFNIPGNLPEMDSVEELAEFMYNESGSVDLLEEYALVPGVGFHGILPREVDEGLNADWVTYPTWGGEYPEHIPNKLSNSIFVSSQSENPDAAFEVIHYLLSDDYQKQSVSEGRLSPLISEEVQNEFGKGMEHYDRLKEKNWETQFSIPGAPMPKLSPYENPIRKDLMINAYQRLLEGDDLNTVIRIMDEEAQNMIEDLAGKE